MTDLDKMVVFLRGIRSGIANPGNTVKVPTGSVVVHTTKLNVYQRVIFLHKLEAFLIYATNGSIRKNNPGLSESDYIKLKAITRKCAGKEIIGLAKVLCGVTGKQWGTKPWLVSGVAVSQDTVFHKLYSDLLFHINAHFSNETNIMSLLFNETFVENLVNVYYGSVNHEIPININRNLDFGTVLYPFPINETAIENKLIVSLKPSYPSTIKREFEESLREHIL